MTDQSPNRLDLVAQIVSAYVSRHDVRIDQINGLVQTVSGALSGAEQPPAPAEKPKPAVPINKSVQNDYLVCLNDGKKLKMLKRYLRTKYGLSPEEYRQQWGLPADYPMVAPNYTQQRSDLAKATGLGTKSGRRAIR